MKLLINFFSFEKIKSILIEKNLEKYYFIRYNEFYFTLYIVDLIYAFIINFVCQLFMISKKNYYELFDHYITVNNSNINIFVIYIFFGMYKHLIFKLSYKF